MNTSFVLMYAFILIILSILLSMKIEKFQDFDDVLDSKCSELNEDTNNYIGPWDGGSGYCAKYTCPNETCSYLKKDPTIGFSTINGFTWVQESKEQTMNIVGNERECLSRHGSMHPTEKSRLNCLDNTENDLNHNSVDFCYETTADGEHLRWKKKMYINTLSEEGVYHWRSVETGDINDMSPTNCIKEPLDCSKSNYFCCEYYTGDDKSKRCTKDTATTADKYIEFNMKKEDGNLTCVENDSCDITKCFTDDNYYKDCWEFNQSYNNADDRKWENKRFKKQMREHNSKDVCDFFYKNKDDSYVRYKDYEPLCAKEEPSVNINDCAKLPNVKCDYLDDHDNVFNITYESRLNNQGNGCVFKTFNNEDLKFYQADNQVQVKSALNAESSDICPVLTPQDCIKNDYLEKKVSQNNQTSHECRKCPPGTYRNDNLFEIGPSGKPTRTVVSSAEQACSPNATCPSVNNCHANKFKPSDLDKETPFDPKNCMSCWSNVDNSYELFQEVFLETSPDKDSCKIVNDVCYYHNEGERFECTYDRVIRNVGDQVYCDNCPNGQSIKIEDGILTCTEEKICNKNQSITCLNNEDNLTFSDYTYDNETDIFSPCRYWKRGTNTPEKKKNQNCLESKSCMSNCITTCPKIYSRNGTAEAAIHLVRTQDDEGNIQCVLEQK